MTEFPPTGEHASFMRFGGGEDNYGAIPGSLFLNVGLHEVQELGLG